MNASQRENPNDYQVGPSEHPTDAWHDANNARIYRETVTQLLAALLSNPECSEQEGPEDAVGGAFQAADAFFAELDRRFVKEDGK